MSSVPVEIKHFIEYKGVIFPAIEVGGDKIILHRNRSSNNWLYWKTYNDSDIPEELQSTFKFGYFIEFEPIIPMSNLAILLHTDLTQEQFYDRISNV